MLFIVAGYGRPRRRRRRRRAFTSWGTAGRDGRRGVAVALAPQEGEEWPVWALADSWVRPVRGPNSLVYALPLLERERERESNKDSIFDEF